ncbi:hypothetical protein HK13_11185 [Acetobacter indonesiensis]|uniref:hypothetical protein n=1 Tax=Acetobacter indonesiensis TaxID=104101 RepID=UPI000A367618|nr:hypothetical protein [Acetobacter indonesiensis]OUI91193.1 hypothetical protein HK13_11185 [Acetobacter indonesiensis]
MDLNVLLGQSEISPPSLRTDKKLITRERAADLYALTGESLHKSRALDEQASPTPLQDQETTLSQTEEYHALEPKAKKVCHTMEMLAQVQKESAYL